MLAALTIRDIVLIDRLHIAFGAGLSVLTGETGAGKSILLDSLSLTLGGRGDAGLVRAGAQSGEVVALFEPAAGHPVWQLLADNGINPEDGLILRRVQTIDGRTRAFINDRPVSAQLMKDVGALLVEIHGQHDNRALIDPGAHLMLLDAFGGLEGEVDSVRAAWMARQAADRALADLEARVAAAARDRDYLAHAVDELGRLSPQPGEEARLADRRQAMMQSEKVADDLKAALAALDGDGALVARLSGVLRKLERQQERAPALIAPPVAALERALSEADEALQALEQAVAACDFDPGELERAEERLFTLRSAARKHNCQVEALPALHARLAADLEALDAGEAGLGKLRVALKAAQTAYDAAADALSAARRQAATALEQAVAGELAPLKLERARFMVQIERDEPGGRNGRDRIEFWVRTNPGTEPGPLRKIASGGELARFILALKVALADRGSAPTLIFDEIDTAVGGAVADAIGQRLARLAQRVQVLAVTHAPQVAARAAGHLRISKDVALEAGESVVTRIATLDSSTRAEEIARMLSGAEVTEEARAQAERLLAAAG